MQRFPSCITAFRLHGNSPLSEEGLAVSKQVCWNICRSLCRSSLCFWYSFCLSCPDVISVSGIDRLDREEVNLPSPCDHAPSAISAFALCIKFKIWSFVSASLFLSPRFRAITQKNVYISLHLVLRCVHAFVSFAHAFDLRVMRATVCVFVSLCVYVCKLFCQSATAGSLCPELPCSLTSWRLTWQVAAYWCCSESLSKAEACKMRAGSLLTPVADKQSLTMISTWRAVAALAIDLLICTFLSLTLLFSL